MRLIYHTSRSGLKLYFSSLPMLARFTLCGFGAGGPGPGIEILAASPLV